jgi:hypothetical protein
VLGPDAKDEATFTPRAALAELIETSPTETTLLVHLTTAPRTCDGLPPPTPDEVAVALRLTLPAGVAVAPGSFPRGALADGAPALSTTVKLRGRKHELMPGGEVSLTRVDATPRGAIEGLLKLEFAGDAERPATRVSGRFLAHFCKISRLR